MSQLASIQNNGSGVKTASLPFSGASVSLAVKGSVEISTSKNVVQIKL